jgi:hypothetical protein
VAFEANDLAAPGEAARNRERDLDSGAALVCTPLIVTVRRHRAERAARD